MKIDTKPWFDIDVLDDIQNCDKYYKQFKWSGKETDNSNFKSAKLLLKK